MRSGRIRKFLALLEYLDIAFTLFLSYQFFRLWLSPNIDDAGMIYSFAILMGFEFIMVHSGVFMSAFKLKASLLIFFPFYGIFALMFNFFVDNNTVLILYLVVVFNRMRFAFFTTDKTTKMKAASLSILGAVVYFLLMFAVAIGAEMLPDFGLNAQFLAASNYEHFKRVGGLFADMPKTAMCLGGFYYLLLSLLSLAISKATFKIPAAKPKRTRKSLLIVENFDE
jgi:hypothetical protein